MGFRDKHSSLFDKNFFPAFMQFIMEPATIGLGFDGIQNTLAYLKNKNIFLAFTTVSNRTSNGGTQGQTL